MRTLRALRTLVLGALVATLPALAATSCRRGDGVAGKAPPADAAGPSGGRGTGTGTQTGTGKGAPSDAGSRRKVVDLSVLRPGSGLASLPVGEARMAQVEEALGTAPGRAAGPGRTYLFYPAEGLAFEFTPDGVLSGIEAENAAFDSLFAASHAGATPEGLKVGDTRNRMVELYGPPKGDAATADPTFEDAFIASYPEKGLWVTYQASSGRIARIRVGKAAPISAAVAPAEPLAPVAPPPTAGKPATPASPPAGERKP